MSLKYTFAQISLAGAFIAVSAAPALAQDAFGSATQTVDTSRDTAGTKLPFTDSIGLTVQDFYYERPPILQGATSGTISPQGSEATVILGVNTADTVLVNSLANLEALLKIVANLFEIHGAWCVPIMIMGSCTWLLVHKAL